MAWVQPLAWVLLHAVGAGEKKKRLCLKVENLDTHLLKTFPPQVPIGTEHSSLKTTDLNYNIYLSSKEPL